MKLTKTRVALLVIAAGLALPLAGLLYYQSSAGASCARCHPVVKSYDTWRASTHREVACSKCHGELLTVDAGFHLANLRRLLTHLRGRQPEQIRLTHREALPIVDRCKKCHEHEYAQWLGGPHGITYAQVFLDQKHNGRRLLMDDCLRCHGMHFAGSIQDLVTPLDTAGPWKLSDPGLANRPTIPCLTCHQVHREGQPLRRRTATQSPTPGPVQEINRPSLALFDRRELTAVPVRLLALPNMKEGDRLVNMSPDARQGLCYQCHAPLASAQVNSGDDRTPVGVHEGISCLACHLKHGQQTRASCAHCHPRLSNCGLDVEKMDTTFLSEKSKHNIHFVKCIDCHPKGAPPKRRAGRPAAAAQ